MKALQIIFSPTGGTELAADIITKELGMPVRKIDLTDAKADYSVQNIEKDELAVIAAPSYGGRVPALAVQRLSKLHGNGALCVVVCVYGNRAYEDTLIELYDAAKECGFKVIAAIAAIAEHSIMHQYAAGRPDSRDKSQLQGFSKKISEKINGSLSELSAAQIPGEHPYKKAGGAGLVPRADSACTGCGLCAEKCPAQAIHKENLKTADSKKCISCMRCVVRCPHSARKVNGALVSAAALAMKKACSKRKENELYI